MIQITNIKEETNMTRISEKIHRSYYRRTGKILVTPLEKLLMKII